MKIWTIPKVYILKILTKTGRKSVSTVEKNLDSFKSWSQQIKKSWSRLLSTVKTPMLSFILTSVYLPLTISSNTPLYISHFLSLFKSTSSCIWSFDKITLEQSLQSEMAENDDLDARRQTLLSTGIFKFFGFISIFLASIVFIYCCALYFKPTIS